MNALFKRNRDLRNRDLRNRDLRNRDLKRNCDAVSEVMGEALLTGIVVLMLGAMGLFIFSNFESPPKSSNSDLDCWINTSSETLYIRHCGGENLDVRDMDIVVNIRGDKRTYISENISAVLGDSHWELGDIIEINTTGTWGSQISEGDSVEVYIVDKLSKHVIQKISLSPAL
ncbi:MAG: type IV pilin N-terminal domain-containing protein [Methanosarcinaceae archaeon]|nr:type IV pilin N-terminal domain-containing protein [Methanosarcinaceae archaeon]